MDCRPQTLDAYTKYTLLSLEYTVFLTSKNDLNGAIVFFLKFHMSIDSNARLFYYCITLQS